MVLNKIMRSPLTSLDELIWKQYEKITQKAAKWGYSKYDLGYLCDTTAAIALTAAGTYLLIEGMLGGNGFIAGIGALGVLSGCSYYNRSNKKRVSVGERDNQELVRYGAVSPPKFTPFPHNLLYFC